MYELLTINEIQNNLSKKIKALRLAQNKTQEDFSRSIGISKSTYVRFEKYADGSFKTFLSIVKGLGRSNEIERLLNLETFSPVKALKEGIKNKPRQRAVAQINIPNVIRSKKTMSILDKIKEQNDK